MRKLLTCSLMMLIVFAFFGCSVRSMYIIRNASKVPVEVILILKGVKDSIEGKNFEIAGAGEIIPLKKSDLYTAFVNKIAGTWDKSGACHFQVPAGWSADITRLLERLNPGRDASADFMGSALEIKNGNSILVFGNNVAEVHRVFEAKSFFLSGPLVYYLDLEKTDLFSSHPVYKSRGRTGFQFYYICVFRQRHFAGIYRVPASGALILCDLDNAYGPVSFRQMDRRG